MKNGKIPAWVIVDIILILAAVAFRFVLVGYDFIAYALVFIAAVITAYRFFGKTLKIILTVLLAAGVTYFIILEVPIVQSARTDSDPQAPYLIVLGAGVNGDQPSLSLANRLDTAYEYMVKYPGSVAVVSGGQGLGENITEAECMYNYLIARDISPDRVIKEDKAASTEENFKYSFEIIRARGDDPDGCAVVSSEYHLYRAKTLAGEQGVDVKSVAAHTSYPLIKLNYFIREAFAVAYMQIT